MADDIPNDEVLIPPTPPGEDDKVFRNKVLSDYLRDNRRDIRRIRLNADGKKWLIYYTFVP